MNSLSRPHQIKLPFFLSFRSYPLPPVKNRRQPPGAGLSFLICLFSCTLISRALHLLSDYRIIISVPVIGALIIPIRHDPHIVVFVHIHIAEICSVLLVIDIEGTCLTASPFFSLHFRHPLFSVRHLQRMPALQSDYRIPAGFWQLYLISDPRFHRILPAVPLF